jgi:flagellar biosynthesis chaperone FliJ
MIRRNLKPGCFFCLYLIFLFFSTDLSAEPWDSLCEAAINDLRRTQQDVSSAHKEFESAKSFYETEKRNLDVCQGDCGHQRQIVNTAIQDYNNHLKELKNAISTFESALQDFRKNCLK